MIVKDGLRRMYGRPSAEDVFYYLTVYNEPKVQPAMPEGVEEGILKGLYRFQEGAPAPADAPRLQLLASGTAIHWALEAQELLAADWGVTADVWSATSWGELRRDALECRRGAAARRGARPVRDPRAGGRAGPGARGQRLDARGARTRSASGSSRTGPRSARTASASPTPVRRPAATSVSTPQSIVVAALAQLARRGEVPARGQGGPGAVRHVSPAAAGTGIARYPPPPPSTGPPRPSSGAGGPRAATMGPCVPPG